MYRNAMIDNVFSKKTTIIKLARTLSIETAKLVAKQSIHFWDTVLSAGKHCGHIRSTSENTRPACTDGLKRRIACEADSSLGLKRSSMKTEGVSYYNSCDTSQLYLTNEEYFGETDTYI